VASGTPLVSVVLAARDAGATVEEAVCSVLGQAHRDLELVVVDDGSSDDTGDVLSRIDDRRLRVIHNDEPLGLAGALNVGLEAARGSYIARMDADDVALPHWLERLVRRMTTTPDAAVVGTGMIDLGDNGRVGTLHRMPAGARAVRWTALFTSPFFHSTVLVDRSVLDRHGLRYDTSFGESEDYDLWARLLLVADGDNIPDALVFYRKHAAQASTRRSELQRECQRRVGLRQLASLVPQLPPERAELAWLAGAGWPLPAGAAADAAAALGEVVHAFERRHSGREARRAAAWALARAGGDEHSTRLRAALALDPTLPLAAARRLARRRAARAERDEAARWLGRRSGGRPVRLTLVMPEPTPFRTLMLDRVALRPELDLTVVYSGTTIARRTWTIEPAHRAVFLEGRRVPGLYRALRHEYPVTFGIFRALADARPEVVVTAGWSTFASQAAALWCRLRKVRYVLLVESNERDPRPGWRRAVKGVVVPWIVHGADEVLVVGSLACEAMERRGVDPARMALFANTVDVESFAARFDALASQRDAMRAGVGLGPEDVAVLSVARLAPEKGLHTLVAAAAAAGDPRLVVVLAGEGPEKRALVARAERLGVRLIVLPDVRWERIVERFALGDVFALLSTNETWGVVVNEAAASGLPLLLSDRVGAAHDLLEDGRNGILVPAGDTARAGEALRALASDPELRRAMGAASRELMREWGYEPSIENLVRVARRVAGRPKLQPTASR
jgi:glycosyltransferase involved in cell wall biosynthesis/GT2 family glycosyltransferase